MLTLQELITTLNQFWARNGCTLHQGYDLETGAGTFNPTTFLRSLGPEPYFAAYVEPSRRPQDGRYGQNPNRMQLHHQFQVLLKPSPLNIQQLYLDSLEEIGLDLSEHDIRFVHDDWESPTLGAFGLGWEVWIDGMECTQFTYFQGVGGLLLKSISGELTYGLERLAMYLQNIDNVWDLRYNDTLSYGDVYLMNEQQWSQYNFQQADPKMWFAHFDQFEQEANTLLQQKLPIPAYDFVLKCSHAFNMLDARGVISVSERANYIARIRHLAKQVAEEYVQARETLGYPLLKKVFLPPATSASVPLSLPQELLSTAPQATADWLLEIGSEELPAAFVPIGLCNLKKSVEQLLKELQVPHGKIEVYGTPRRLAVIVSDLALRLAPKALEKKGPAIASAYDPSGTPMPAAKGFFASLGLPSAHLSDIQQGKVEGLSVRSFKGTDYLFASLMIQEQATAALLQERLPALIAALEFPKKMRWNEVETSYARPLSWFVSLIDTHILPFSLAGIAAGRTSRGHRQRCPTPFPISHPKDYKKLLYDHYVIVDPDERADSLYGQIRDFEAQSNSFVLMKDRVGPEVLHLTEWPTLVEAKFDEEFLKIPQEVLISEMVEHQRYFPVADHYGQLKNVFLITADNQPTPVILQGNQKALSPRLADGAYLFNQDLATSLTDYNEILKGVTFLKGAGSMYDKVLRLVDHVTLLHTYLPIADLLLAQRGALLCKADLPSSLVKEFPHLQGTIGKHYALAQKEPKEVALAIEEHWQPRHEKDPLPSHPISCLVSLADKLDNLIAAFALQMRPSSSSDPYALRRQTLGILKTLIVQQYHLPLKAVLKGVADIFFQKTQLPNHLIPTTIEEVMTFITSRVKTVFCELGVHKDEVEASLSEKVDDVYDTFCKVQALHEFRKTPAFALLYEVYKRARGQLDGLKEEAFSEKLLVQEEEKTLWQAIHELTPHLETALQQRDYQAAYAHLAHLQPPLAALFEHVRIMDEDASVRNNRVALLQKVFAMFGRLLDLSKLQDTANHEAL